MAFDGIVIANLVSDLQQVAEGGRISKIAQPEADELLLTIKKGKEMNRVCLSANASLPLVYITSENRPSPMTAPNFCMLLRKHIGNALIKRIHQPDMERVICFELEHFNELGDLTTKYLYVELMGKHSNIIYCNDQNMILDSIKHVSARISSVREVLPGRDYFIPNANEKINPLTEDSAHFMEQMHASAYTVQKALYMTYNGLSPVVASEICHRSSIHADAQAADLDESYLLHLWNHFSWMMDDVAHAKFEPVLIHKGKEPIEFSSVRLTQYRDMECETYESISLLLRTYYKSKEIYSRIRQKSVDLRKIVSTDLDRCRRKYDLQIKQLKDTEKREKYRIYGELINTYGYQLAPGSEKLTCINYYNDKEVSISLDPHLSISENAQKYFERYNKLKRTHDDLEQRTVETKADLDHLLSVTNALSIAVSEADLVQIKEELIEAGYIRKQSASRKNKRSEKSKPFHYKSSDGFDIYVGKNNLQNDELTFKVANGGDWWFHAKKMPGSHVIIKTGGLEMTDRAFEEAAALAAYYSSGRDSEKVEIDYLERRNVKKPNGAKPGYVVYYTNYSMNVAPDISNLTLVEES